MSDYDNAIFRLATAQGAEPEDYTGEDGLLYCGSCRQPKEAYFPEGKTFFGRDRHPKECDCQRKRRERWNTAGQGEPAATTPAMSANGRRIPWCISLKTGNTRAAL